VGTTLFFEKNNGYGSKLSLFTTTAIRHFGVSDGQRKSSEEFLRQHTLIATPLFTVLHCFWMICLRYASNIRKDLTQVACDLIERFHVSSASATNLKQLGFPSIGYCYRYSCIWLNWMLGKIWHWIQHFAACVITIFVFKNMSIWQFL